MNNRELIARAKFYAARRQALRRIDRLDRIAVHVIFSSVLVLTFLLTLLAAGCATPAITDSVGPRDARCAAAHPDVRSIGHAVCRGMH